MVEFMGKVKSWEVEEDEDSILYLNSNLIVNLTS